MSNLAEHDENIQRSTDLAVRVNDLLSRYIAVHNALFGFSLRKVIPIPGLFKALDFTHFTSDLNKMVAELTEVDKDIDAMIPSVDASSSVGSYLAGLQEYSNALADTIAQLSTLCHNLNLKSKRSSKFTWTQHQQAIQGYQASVERYMALGGRLNELFAVMQTEGNYPFKAGSH